MLLLLFLFLFLLLLLYHLLRFRFYVICDSFMGFICRLVFLQAQQQLLLLMLPEDLKMLES
jgi:hypothetical protein